jgi:protein-disulfide isomerase
MEPRQPQQINTMMLIGVIFFGCALIAAAIFFTRNSQPSQTGAVIVQDDIEIPTDVTTESQLAAFTPITGSDYIRGNGNAQIMIVTYSDYDCPHCARFHQTMKLIMQEYGLTGEIGWVYRQFPIESLHPNSVRLSEAGLCVGELGGSTAFWEFTDLLYERRDDVGPANITRIDEFAERAGVEFGPFNLCLESGRMRDAAVASFEEALALGAEGTPFSLVIAGDQTVPLRGALPLENVRSLIEAIQVQLEGGEVTFERTETESSDASTPN